MKVAEVRLRSAQPIGKLQKIERDRQTTRKKSLKMRVAEVRPTDHGQFALE